MFGGGEKIGKGVALSLQPAGVVPWFAKFSAAANVRQRVNDTAIEQAETIGIEVDGQGDAKAAIAVEEQGSGAVARGLLPMDQGERHLSAVGSGGVPTFDDVLSRIIASENCLLFLKDA